MVGHYAIEGAKNMAISGYASMRKYAQWHSVYGIRFGHTSMRIDTWCGYVLAHWHSVYGTRFGHASMRSDTWCGCASMRIGTRFMALALTLGVAAPVCALALGLWHSLWTRQCAH